MKIPTSNASAPGHGALRHLVPLTIVLAALSGPVSAQTNITLDNTAYQYFAVDTVRHFLYAGESSNAGIKHLNVINTLTNTIVGTYSFSTGGYSSQIAASGTNVFWADQGSNLLRVIAVNGSGVPSLTRSDAATQATGVAALSTTYAVSKQGGGDFMSIRQISSGTELFNVNLGGVAGQVYADANTNLYYARSTSDTKVINTSGTIVGTLSNKLVMAIDSSASNNFIYIQDGGTPFVLSQLAGANQAATGNTFNFAAAYGGVAVNDMNGDVFVSQQALNRVVHLSSSLAFIQYLSVPNAGALAIIDAQLYVHQAGSTTLSVLAIPEPGTWAVLSGSAALCFAVWRRRAGVRPA